MLSNKFFIIFIILLSKLSFASGQMSFLSSGEKIIEINGEKKTITVDVISVPADQLDEKTISFIDAFLMTKENKDLNIKGEIVYENDAQKQTADKVASQLKNNLSATVNFNSQEVSPVVKAAEEKLLKASQRSRELYAQLPGSQTKSLKQKYQDFFNADYSLFNKLNTTKGHLALTVTRFTFGGGAIFASIFLNPKVSATLGAALAAGYTFGALTGTIQLFAEKVFVPLLGTNKLEKALFVKTIAPTLKLLGIANSPITKNIINAIDLTTKSKPWMYLKFFGTQVAFLAVYNTVCGMVGLPTLTAADMMHISALGTASQGLYEEAISRTVDMKQEKAKAELNKLKKLSGDVNIFKSEIASKKLEFKSYMTKAAHGFLAGSALWATATALAIYEIDISNLVFGLLGGTGLVIGDLGRGEKSYIKRFLKSAVQVTQDQALVLFAPLNQKLRTAAAIGKIYSETATTSAKKVYKIIQATPYFIKSSAKEVATFLKNPRKYINMSVAANQAKSFQKAKEVMIKTLNDKTIVARPTMDNLIKWSGLTGVKESIANKLRTDIELNKLIINKCEQNFI